MPKWAVAAIAIIIALALVPFALVARARSITTTKPRLHVFSDMDNQPRFGPQQANPAFADGRAMRRPVTGTIARGDVQGDIRYERGYASEDWAGEEPDWVEAIPVAVDRGLLERGRARFDVFCAPCHGLDGAGRGIVSQRAEALEEGTWVPPVSFHTDSVRERPPGHLFNTITNGIRTMPAYGSQVPVADRWAIAAYLRALQRSQNARLEDVPEEMRAKLR
jgi:mono/diheme cytochrome c family protein